MPDFIAGDGLRLHVEVSGPDDAPTVVLVHGLAASVDLGWRSTGVLDRLADAGLRTVAFDARGHGRSDTPADPGRYGDDRAATDLREIVAAFADQDAILVGYSMGAATILVALAAGLVAGRAVVGAAPSAVITWSAADEAQVTAVVAVLEGREHPDAAMDWWLEFLDSTGADRVALAALLRGHRPVIDRWDAITTPIVFATGVDDAAAAPLAELAARVPGATVIELPGDHITAAASLAFTDAVVEMARRTR